jgi:hypothetical protein
MRQKSHSKIDSAFRANAPDVQLGEALPTHLLKQKAKALQNRKRPRAAKLTTPYAPYILNTTSGSVHPTHEEIARIAYLHFQNRGGNDGHDFDDWIMAEASLKAEYPL